MVWGNGGSKRISYQIRQLQSPEDSFLIVPQQGFDPWFVELAAKQ
jgi:hypothetical protein